MKIFWKILAELYSDLVVSGFNLAAPKILFNNPKSKLHTEFSATILADINFDDSERLLILEALDDLHKFCNGLVELQILFELDPKDKETINDNYVLLKVTPEHPSIVASDKKIESTTLGLCEYMENHTIRLYLVPERLKSPIGFRTTTIHELGHFLGLAHTECPSIMHRMNYYKVLYPTYIDAVAIGKLSGHDPESFCYFKM